jgi:hypothetical protein
MARMSAVLLIIIFFFSFIKERIFTNDFSEETIDLAEGNDRTVDDPIRREMAANNKNFNV